MKNVSISLCFALILSTIIISCNKANQAPFNNYELAKADSSGANYFSGQRKLIHKAAIDINVNNCIETVNKIEEKVALYKGFILKSDMERVINKTDESEIGLDSIKQQIYYENKANLIVRIPDTSLQNFLLFVQQISTIVFNRKIDADDITFVQSNTMVNNTEENIAHKKNNESVVNLWKLQDDLKYCTVSIKTKEPLAYFTQNIVNTNTSWTKESSIFSKLKMNFQKGFVQLANLLVNIMQFWYLIPLFITFFYVYKKVKPIVNKLK